MTHNIYADNAATTRIDNNALEAMMPFLLEQYGNASQPYSFSRHSRKAIQNARTNIASCINANSNEIYFTSGGTESDNWVIKSFANNPSFQNIIITSNIEHHAILNACEAISKNTQIIKLPVDNQGTVIIDSLRSALNDIRSYKSNSRILVSIMTANNEIGTIQPIKKLSKISHEYGALFHTDAVQAVGHMLIDVRNMDIDMLSASAHKFNGPKGIGFLYMRDGLQLCPFIDGGKQENGLRAGTENTASIVGMSVALKNNIDAIEQNAHLITELEHQLFERLDSSKIDYIRNGSKNHIPGNISLSIKNANGEMILHRLDLKGIYISTGSACDSKNTQISHVIKAIGLDKNYAEGTIRISLGKYNTLEEIDAIAAELINILSA